MDGGEEVAGGLLLASGDGAKLLDPGEDVLDQMAFGIKLSVKVAQQGAMATWGDHRGGNVGSQPTAGQLPFGMVI